MEVADPRDEMQQGWTRRMILTMTMAIATSPALTSKAAVTSTKENSLGNSFLRTLGIGDPDIYYPR
jgi:hypothetical protein